MHQGRHKSFPVEADEYSDQVVRYVERNALRSNLVAKAEAWQWGRADQFLKMRIVGDASYNEN
jgi:putative transposase